ncbi:MAG TPA: VWA domain-containing protein, partial [Gemmataceae bacterium]|nr:VWA domain-containing protein [Gemmataceae bacterium]
MALLLLAIPGVILFGLNLYGQDGPVNQWLEGAYQLSYHILIPWWGGLLLLLVPLFLLLLYFLKLKRKPLSVPSTFLWKKSIEDLHVNSLLQWLRQNVLLLLQLLALLAMIYGIMAFQFHGSRSEGKPYILMVDNSASMSATDVAPNRLEWAKQEALKEIDAHGDQDVGMVIVFNSSAEIRQSFTSNRHLLRAAVNKIEPTQRPTRIEEALSLADSMANPLRSTENVSSQPENQEAGKERTYVQPKGTPTDVHLFSDGRFPDLSESFLANLNSKLGGNESALGNLNVHFHMAGTAGADNADNIALVTFNALRDDRDPTLVQAFVRVLNFRTRETITKIRLEVFENHELKKVYEKSLTLRARRPVEESVAKNSEANTPDIPEESATFDLTGIDPGKNTMLHAKLMDVNDKFPLDDEAWMVINVPRKARVLIVGGLNEALDKFFGAEEVLEVAQVDQLTPKDLSEDTYRKAARNGTYDLVVFDRSAPASEQDMPRSNTFFIGMPPPPWKKENLEIVPNPAITGWTNNHPVLRDLRALYTIGIGEAYKIKKDELPPRTPFLI